VPVGVPLRSALPLVVAFVCGCTDAPDRKGEGEPPRVPSIERLYADVEALVARHYPSAVFERTQEGVRFEFGTRTFFVHEPLKTGQWQDAFEMKGPDRGGILGDITLEKGPYQGAAEVPQSFDKRYFTMLLMAPDLPALDAHLRVELRYPADASPEFLKELRQLVDGLSS
jgi:hypothetical protein